MNHQNKIIKAPSLSLSLSLSRKNALRVFRAPFVVFVAASILLSGFFVANTALAAATVYPASGGTNISIDTTSGGGSNVPTGLEGPVITEAVAGDIAVGTHTITLPLGWEFDTSSNITISKIYGNIVLGSTSVTPTQTSFSFVVSSQSTSVSILSFNNLKVRPTGITPSTGGDMTHSGVAIAGVVDGSTNFGTLSTIAGTVTKLAFTIQPGGTVYGSLLNPQPVVKTQDQFGNDSTSGVAGKTVTLSLIGSGALLNATPLDISSGTASFTNLTVDEFGTGKQLTASADGLTPAVSTVFEITKKVLTATITAGSKIYDGSNSATFTSPTPVGTAFSDVLTLSGGSATFADANVGTGKTVTATGLILGGAKANNYTYDTIAIGAANITAKPITITPTAGQTEVYGNADPTFAYTFDPALIGTDSFTGALSRVAGKNVGTYAYTLGTLSAGSNYSLTLTPEIFTITQRALNVTATGINKVYDANTTATVNLSDDRVLGDALTFGYMATFSDKIVANGKTVNVSGISITGGDDVGNYILGNVPAATTANITPKPLTVSFTTDANKTYDGDNFANITGRSLSDVISSETVGVTGGSATFADKHIGAGKTVTATGFILTGDDKDNYTIGTINTTTGNVNTRPITITAVTDNRIYNGTAVSGGTPTITSTFSPPVALVDTANFIQTYDNKNVGTGKTLTPSGAVSDGNSGLNYTVTFVPVSTGEVTQKSLNVTAQTDTKVYDGTPTSSIAPVVGTLETGDLIGTAPTQTYNTKDVGTGKTLTASGLVINDGNSGLNYIVTYVPNVTGVINAKVLTVTGATTNSKIYNGDAIASVNFGSATLVGKIAGEEALVSLNSTGHSATFNNKNVSTGKTVTVSGLALAGTGAGNYSLTQPILTDGVITQRALNVTATGIDKIYNADTNATVNLLDDRVSLDDLTLRYTAAFTDKNVGIGKTVNISGISITGGDDVGNYILGNVPAATTANITPAPLTATITVANKVYDGNNSATITDRTLIGVLGTDVVTPNADGIATFADATVGTGKVVSATGITIAGTDKDNYAYNGTATGTGNILPIPTIVYVDDNWVGTTLGADPDDTGPATAFGYDAFATIQDSISKVAVGGTVNVAAGTYDEQVVVSKSLTLQGVGDTTIIKPSSADKLVQNYTISWAGGTKKVASIIVVNQATGGNVTIKGLKIDGEMITAVPSGANWVAGILYGESGGVINNVTATNITVGTTGTAVRGYGIYLYAAGENFVSVEVMNSRISNYDKNGINAQGNKLTANIHDNTVTGRGSLPEGDEVQNGILVIDNAVGTVNNNIISNNAYAPAAWGATGIAFVNAGGSAQGNTLTSNQMGAAAQVLPGFGSGTSWAVSFVGNTVNALGLSVPGISGLNAATYISGVTLNVIMDGNQLTGGLGDGISIGDLENLGPAGSVIATIRNNVISNWQHGIHLISSVGAGTTITGNTIMNNISTGSGIHIKAAVNAANVVANLNRISGNQTFGVNNGGSGVLDAKKNWWNTTDGATIVSLVSGNVNYRPWCIEETCTTIDTTPPAIVSYTPSDNAVGVDPTAPITVTFSEAVNVTASDVTLITGTTEVTVTIGGSGTSNISIVPAATLDNNSTYTVTIKTTVADLAGNNLAQQKVWSFTTAGSYSFTLTNGWNLISLGVVPNNTSIATILDSASVESVWTYNAVNDAWYVYRPTSTSTSNLLSMTAGYGYWVNYTGASAATLSGPGNLFLAGNNTPPSRTLKAGWNLIGYYQRESYSTALVTNALKTLKSQDAAPIPWWSMIVKYDNGEKQFGQVDNSESIYAGQGYWILMGGRATDTYIYAPGITP